MVRARGTPLVPTAHSDGGPLGIGMADATQVLNDVEGTVKWFDPRKGYGFLVGPQEQDIFVHYTVIEGDGFRALSDGADVVYSAENSDKGWRATKVVAVKKAPAAGPDEDASHEEAEVVVPRSRTYSRTPRR